MQLSAYRIKSAVARVVQPGDGDRREKSARFSATPLAVIEATSMALVDPATFDDKEVAMVYVAARLSESIYVRVLAALRGGSEHNMPNLSEKQIRKARPHFRRAVSEGVEVVLCGYSCPDGGWVGWVERAGNAAALRWIAFADGVPGAIQTGKRLLQRAGFLAFPLVATWCVALRTSISER